MTLTYITRADTSASSAQARQISSMARAFNDILGDQFALVSAGSQINTIKNHRPLRTKSFPKFRYVEACLVAASSDVKRVFTREVAVAFCACLAGKSVALEAHRDPVGFFSPLLLRLLKRFSNFRLVCISNALAEYMKIFFGFPAARILVAHDGVFLQDYESVQPMEKSDFIRELQIPHHKKLIVHTGSLYKGGGDLFRHAVASQNFNDILFLHIGGSEGECNYWTDFYKRNNYGNVLFRSHKSFEDIKRYQVCADALFYISVPSSPIHWCTSPLKIFEYMASKTPIIASTAGSVGEVLNESNCFPYDLEDVTSISRAVEDVFGSSQRAEARAQTAFNEVCDKYRWEIRVKKILELYG